MPKDTMFTQKVEEAIHILVNTGRGFSISQYGAEMPDKGYMVGGFGFELRIVKEQLDANTISRFAWFLQSISTSANRFIGGWMDDRGNVCIDISKCIADFDEAMREGRANNQDAIYDIANDTDHKC